MRTVERVYHTRLMSEIWKPVVGYEGIYSVSDIGRVRRDKTGRIRKRVCDSRGYAQVTLSRDNRPNTYLVHSLVMRAHVGPRPDGMEVCHNDGDTANANLKNLRYDTHAANLLDRRSHGTASTNVGEHNGQSILTADDVRVIRSTKASAEALANRYGVSKGTIWDARSRRRWAHID